MVMPKKVPPVADFKVAIECWLSIVNLETVVHSGFSPALL